MSNLSNATIKKTNKRYVRGAILLELILVAPLILFITGYILRFTQILEARQVAIAVTREIVTQAYKNCVDITIFEAPNATNTLTVDVGDTTDAIQTCLDTIADDFDTAWPLLAPSSIATPPATGTLTLNMTVEVFRYDLANLVSNDCTAATDTLFTNVGATLGAGATDEAPDATDLCNRNRIARARISFDIEPLFTFLSLREIYSDTGASSTTGTATAPTPIPNTITIEETSEI